MFGKCNVGIEYRGLYQSRKEYEFRYPTVARSKMLWEPWSWKHTITAFWTSGGFRCRPWSKKDIWDAGPGVEDTFCSNQKPKMLQHHRSQLCCELQPCGMKGSRLNKLLSRGRPISKQTQENSSNTTSSIITTPLHILHHEKKQDHVQHG